MSDPIHMPAHYVGRTGLEARRVIEDCGLAPGFYLGNALKYVLRAGKKAADPLPDLMKARRNLEMLAEVESGALSGGTKRVVPVGLVAAEFGLSERLACVIGILTMPFLHACETSKAIELLSEEIVCFEEARLVASLPVPNTGRAA